MIGDVTWSTPGQTSADSLPLGNGNIAANAWTEPGGDIVAYLAKNDAWDSLGRLIKLGRIRVRITPPLVAKNGRFEQRLSLGDASMLVSNGETSVKLWIDAHAPRLVVDVTSTTAVSVAVSVDDWRSEPRIIPPKEAHGACGLEGGTVPLATAPDQIDTSDPVAVIWYQRNESSIWGMTLDQQGLAAFKSTASDPLFHRTFGGRISGAGMVRGDGRTLVSTSPQKTQTLAVAVHTAQTESADEWIAQIRAQSVASHALPAELWRDHELWWSEFWSRSYIRLESLAPDWGNARKISEQSAWQRYLVACCSRGLYPLKFNGGLFTADWGVKDEGFDADYRRWGGGYWWQNTRLPYWATLASGDHDLLRPLFRMYRDMLPLAEQRTRAWFNHGGAFFSETFYFWGTYLPSNYGWDRVGKKTSEVENRYIGRLYLGGLELVALMLETHAHTQDAALLEHELLPIARAVLEFYATHYPERDGQLRIAPAQALETWWEAENPLPDVAGLHDVVGRLLALPRDRIAANDVAAWSRLLARLPMLPTTTSDGKPHFSPAEKHEAAPSNMENAELYAVFPFKLYGLGRPDLETARWTFAKRMFPDTGGWRQDALHAALLGLTETAAFYVTKNYTEGGYANARFKGFWGPNYDWVPDFDHGSVTQLALQAMLVQSVGDKIYLFPAWPAERWNVSFKLHVVGGTVVEAELKQGELTRLSVTPAERAGDVVNLLGKNKARLG
ncbi:MAG: hypothetical protein JWM32_1628 [Verrucomicrobia bacterium]|nr:hypothetical protein [Verrucomicrobiota bacterium]